MRKKDDSKRMAMFRAAQDIVVHEGFTSVSMSKIAEKAAVAPTTLYTYFKDKDDLLEELFFEVHGRMFDEISDPIESGESYEQWFRKIWMNMYEYIISNPHDFSFFQQFQASPRMKHICHDEKLKKQTYIIEKIISMGREDGYIRPLPKEAIYAFVFFPTTELAKMKLSGQSDIDSDLIKRCENLAWEILSAK